jgi:hypothetical protein
MYARLMTNKGMTSGSTRINHTISMTMSRVLLVIVIA